VLPGAHQVYVQNPTQDPATAFRYVNLFKGWVGIPAYKMEGVQVLAQHLPDTEIHPIAEPLTVAMSGSEELQMAMMQGFVTLPFVEEQVGEVPWTWNCFGIVGYRMFDATHDFFNTQDGVMLNYDRTLSGGPTMEEQSRLLNFEHIAGVGDSHTGNDYLLPIGNCILSGLPTSRVYAVSLSEDPEIPVNLLFMEPISRAYIESGGGHLSVRLAQLDQPVYRGQIIGLSGNTGAYSPAVPQLHFGLAKRLDQGWCSMELY
jgi:hypothetical protein